MAGEINSIASVLGIPLWFFVIILVWSLVWKLLALWKAARKNSIVWFVILAVVNTVGILEILYIFLFSKMEFGISNKKSAAQEKIAKKKIQRKKK